MLKCRQISTTTFPIQFKLYLASDHISAATGLTPAVSISKNGGAFAAGAGLVTELTNGWYSWAGNATDRNTLGELAIRITAATADPYEDRYVVVPYDPFDAVRLGLTALPNAVAGALGGLPLGDAAGDVTLAAATHTGAVIPTVTAVTNDVGITQAGADKVWSSAARTLTSFGTLVADIWAAVVDSSGVATLLSRLTAGRATNLDNLDAAVSTRLASAGYTAPPTAAANADAVWDEAIAGHLAVGSTGAALNAAGSAGDPWVTALPGAYGAGSAGFIVGNNLNAAVSTRATQTSVDDLPTNAELTTALDAIPTAVENADALLDRNMATGTDSGSPTVRTPRQALRALRNRGRILAGVLNVYMEDDTTVSWTAAAAQSAGNPVTEIDPA